ncbi:ATP-binding cassette domain-containing protein [Paenibacillus sp. FSL H8-0537]|uniref:ABC transporter ATP-binding protein n=1 Tax=Paenibacillus sp. FSL H8-0537 TaxID=2921399 RepID=UPI0031018D51
MEMIIEAKELSREFTVYNNSGSSFVMLNQMLFRKGQKKCVVDQLNLTINKGEFIGYLGPNGAGKSTTIKMLSGVLRPTSGELSVLGMSPTKNRKEYAKHIGVLYGQRTQLWWDLPLIDSFELLKSIYKVPDSFYKDRLYKFVELLDMQEFLNRPVRVLSLGQRMKGEMVATLLHNPQILFLDEPTIGLDVLAKDRIQNFLRTINKEEKVTIMLTSHNMDDIEKLCDRVVLIDHGKVMFDGNQQELKRLTPQKKTLIIDVAAEDIGKTPVISPVKIEENRMYFEIADDSEVPKIITQLSVSFTLLKIEMLEPGIEDVLKELYATRNYSITSDSAPIMETAQ